MSTGHSLSPLGAKDRSVVDFPALDSVLNRLSGVTRLGKLRNRYSLPKPLRSLVIEAYLPQSVVLGQPTSPLKSLIFPR